MTQRTHLNEVKQEDSNKVNLICSYAKANNIDALTKFLNTLLSIYLRHVLLDLAVKQIASEEVVHDGALNLLIEKGASLNAAVSGAAFRGHKELVFKLLKDGALLCFAAESAAQGGHFDLVEELFFGNNYQRRMKNLSPAVKGALLGGYLNDERSALQVLLSFKDHQLREAFVNEVHKNKDSSGNVVIYDTQVHLNYDPRLLVADANLIACSDKITPEQRMFFSTPEIQAIFMCCNHGYLPSALYLVIAGYILPDSNVKNLFEKNPLEKDKIYLILEKIDSTIALRNFHLSNSRFAFLRDKRPLMLMEKCQKAKSKDDLEEEFKNEISSLTKKNEDAYRKVLENHSKRKNPGKK